MPGILFLLDEANRDRIERLWDQIEREFDVAKGYPGALPHFTLHLANSYDLEATQAELEDIANARAPFDVTTTGLGVFTGELPIVYIPVIRTRTLDDLHLRLYRSLGPHCSGHVPYYAPASWMPHISIGQVNIAPHMLSSLLAWLSHQPLSWEMSAATLAIGENSASGIELLGTFPLRG
ncbi:MAG: 2'-5' RNA ligase family protein [Anaerolineaceae bacterium]